jgi:translation elongation factor EF-Tu-like GTPase
VWYQGWIVRSKWVGRASFRRGQILTEPGAFNDDQKTQGQLYTLGDRAIPQRAPKLC